MSSPKRWIRPRWESGRLLRTGETEIRLMGGDGIRSDGVPWVDGSLDLSTGARCVDIGARVSHPAQDPRTPPSAPRPLRGPFTRWPRTADAVLASVVYLASLLFLSSEEPNEDLVIRALSDVPIAAFFLFAAASGALYWRRSQPLMVLGLTLAASALTWGFGPTYDYFGLPFALYSVGRYTTDDRWSYAAVGTAITVAAISDVVDGGPLSDIGSAFFALFLVWYIGRRIRIRGDYMRLLQGRAAQLEREHAADARRAVAEERTRIARELHDVVAHRVSVMTVQAGAAKTVAADDPAGAVRAMEAVEQAGRQALGELRHLLGVLRPQADVDELGPQPGITDVPRLVDQLGEAGLEVSLTMDDLPTDLPAQVDLSSYRIVQEALTNVLKHAGPSARTEVRLSTDDHRVVLRCSIAGTV